MVDWATVGASVGLSVVGSLIVTEFQIRRELSVEESQEIDDWYDQSAAYAAQIRRIWQLQWDQADVPGRNFSKLSSKISLQETQISQHASSGEQLAGVDQDVVDALDQVANECRSLSEHSRHLNDIEEIQEIRDNILEAVGELEEKLDIHT
ncbi:hypothetical protein [Halorubrum sp. F4]|uniref:hypothetical protein n=1 Tax=Halorubrum sp. F4 TaxID=2989715 RepID=UPI002480391A|nr:hypothetical protein [Halorubrum sp. F4]